MYHTIGGAATGATGVGVTLAYTGADPMAMLWMSITAVTLLFAGLALRKMLPKRPKEVG